MKKLMIVSFLLAILLFGTVPTTLAAACSSNADCGGSGICTAIGCINVKNPGDFTESILNISFGIGGGIAFLLLAFGAIQVLTSSGNPEKLKGGQQMITSAISGLLLIVFAVFILRVIGVDVLMLPDFGQ